MIDRYFYLEALVEVFEYETYMCSVYSHAHHASTYDRLIELGDEVTPILLRRLARGSGGRIQMQLLGEITGEWPSASADTHEGGWVKTNVAQARELWVAWGREKGFL